MTTWLVTGGCGFIGSNFIRLMLEERPELTIVNVDKLTYAGNPDNLDGLPHSSRYRFFQVDIADETAVKSVLEETQPDAVLNFAAESHVDRSILDSGPFIRTNIVGTQVLLDACRRANVPRFLQVSTDEVYGSLGATGAFTEETPLHPNSPYSASKAAADLIVQSYVHTFSFPATITRCSNNYGPRQFPEKLIPLFLSNAMSDIPVPVYGQGLNVRDWIYVDDHARGIEAALEKGRIGEAYNFGGACELTNMELTRRLLSAVGKTESLIRYVPDRPGHDLRYAIDFSKAERELGWKPLVQFEDGLARTIQWYQDNSAWVDRVKSGAYREYYREQYSDRLAASTSTI